MTVSHLIAFASLLRHYRTAAGLTQEEMADRARLSARTIGDLERGVRKMPHKDTVALLIEALALGETDATMLRAAARRSRRVSHDPSVEPSTAYESVSPVGWHTPLIGCDLTLATIVQLLSRQDVRLLTLASPAGIGKTRLALQVASDLGDSFSSGAVFISLVTVSEPAIALPAMVGARWILLSQPEAMAKLLYDLGQVRPPGRIWAAAGAGKRSPLPGRSAATPRQAPVDPGR
jgi:transcriptional regulator with XRE-family HTH domain